MLDFSKLKNPILFHMLELDSMIISRHSDWPKHKLLNAILTITKYRLPFFLRFYLICNIFPPLQNLLFWEIQKNVATDYCKAKPM